MMCKLMHWPLIFTHFALKTKGEKMNGLFGINGLLGFLVAVLLVVGLAIGFGIVAADVQKSNSTNYYQIKDSQNIESKSVDNKKFYQDAK